MAFLKKLWNKIIIFLLWIVERMGNIVSVFHHFWLIFLILSYEHPCAGRVIILLILCFDKTVRSCMQFMMYGFDLYFSNKTERFSQNVLHVVMSYFNSNKIVRFYEPRINAVKYQYYVYLDIRLKTWKYLNSIFYCLECMQKKINL